MSESRNKRINNKPDTARPSTHNMIEALFSKRNIIEERHLIQKEYPAVEESVAQSYRELDEKREDVCTLLSQITMSKFKKFLLDQGASEQIIALAEVLKEETESILPSPGKR